MLITPTSTALIVYLGSPREQLSNPRCYVAHLLLLHTDILYPASA
jgi:hypothetical protein